MKLIDLLVQELPKRGGWPEGAVECERFIDEATIDFYDWCGNWPVDCGEKYGAIAVKCIKPREAGDGYRKENVKKEEYEVALAASKQPEWTGEGLPPVGCECEAFDGVSWFPVVIVGRYDGFAFAWNYDYRKTLTVNEEHSINFRPIRTEAERKRGEIAQQMCNLFGNGIEIDEKEGYGKAWLDVYDAIAAGKIPGIRLTDDTGK